MSAGEQVRFETDVIRETEEKFSFPDFVPDRQLIRNFVLSLH